MATNIIENFENPTLRHGKITSAVEKLSETLHTPVKLVRNTAIEDSDNQSSMKRKNKAWFDPTTQEVYINLDNTVDAEDAQRSYLHEVVGHYGLRELLGEDFENSMFDMFEMLPKEKKDEIGRYMQKTMADSLHLWKALAMLWCSRWRSGLVKKLKKILRPPGGKRYVADLSVVNRI